jgi:tyrosyl-tRNA synthetase
VIGMKRLKIGAKLKGLCIGLVVIPFLLIGGFSLYKLMEFSGDVTGMTNERLTADAERQLLAGAQRVRNEVDVFVDTIVSDTLKLAGSGTLVSYLEAVSGTSELWNQITRNHSETILEGIMESATVQNRASTQTLKASLALAHSLMQGYGAFDQTERTVEWNVINQFTRDAQPTMLPERTEPIVDSIVSIKLGETG